MIAGEDFSRCIIANLLEVHQIACNCNLGVLVTMKGELPGTRGECRASNHQCRNSRHLYSLLCSEKKQILTDSPVLTLPFSTSALVLINLVILLFDTIPGSDLALVGPRLAVNLSHLGNIPGTFKLCSIMKKAWLGSQSFDKENKPPFGHVAVEASPDLSLTKAKRNKALPGVLQLRSDSTQDTQTSSPPAYDCMSEISEYYSDADADAAAERGLIDSDSVEQIVRATWMFDGCKSFEEIAARCEKAASTYQQMHINGYTLDGEVLDDYGFWTLPFKTVDDDDDDDVSWSVSLSGSWTSTGDIFPDDISNEGFEAVEIIADVDWNDHFPQLPFSSEN